jgi:hypothetical protein
MPITKKLRSSYLLPTIAILEILAGLGLRWYWIMASRFPFNSDEAIVGLMAKHILAGERPVFFYGQVYMGSLDAWMNAAGFLLFGQSIQTMRIVQSILWLILLGSVFFLAGTIYRNRQAGWCSLILFAFPPVNQVLYSTVTLGGYNEAMVLGCWVLILAVMISRRLENHINQAKIYLLTFLLGLISGFGVWVFGFSLVFSIPAVIFAVIAIVRSSNKKRILFPGLACLAGGGLIGATPWWIYAFSHGFAPMIKELSGSAVAVESQGFFLRTMTHLFSFILLGIPAATGFRPPWSVEWLVLPLLPFVLIGWILVIRQSYKTRGDFPDQKVLGWVILTLAAVFLFTPFGIDPSGRYFLPVSLVLTVLAGGMTFGWKIKNIPIGYALIGLFVVYQLFGSIQAERKSPAGITTQFAPDTEIDHAGLQQVAQFLSEHHLQTGFTDYWIAYPLAFETNEQAIFIPRLPYHHDFSYTLRDDRYSPYTQKVYSSSGNSYITYHNPDLDTVLEKGFSGKGIPWQKGTVGDYSIYYRLSSDVIPEDLGLGGVGLLR